MRALFPFISLYRHHWQRLSLGIILAITGLSAAIGLLSLSGWFLAASALVGSSVLFNFFYPSSGVRGLAIGRTLARYFERLVTHDATFRVLANLRVAVFRRLIPLSPAKLSRFRHSELLNRLVADVDTLDTLYLNLMSPFFSAIAVIMFMAIGLSFLSWQLVWLICGSLSLLLCIFPLVFYRLGRHLGKVAVQSRAHYRSRFIEWINLNAEFLLFGILSQKSEALSQTEQAWQAAQSRESHLSGISTAVLIIANGILVCASILLAGSAISAPNAENPEALIALVVFCVLASLEILTPIGIAFLHLGQVITAAERISEVTEQQPTVQFNGNAPWQPITPGETLIRFENVAFRYHQTAEWVLPSFSLNVASGQKIAILGKTGSGKSTIFQLLCRHYDPNEGQIWLNGKPIADYAESTLRSHIAVLSQRVHIFSATLRDNLQFAAPNADDTQLSEALQRVGLQALLNQEEKLDLWLGEGGRPLSGGEQRRLGLARILLTNAEIILLDEPTEGLDRETEQQILQQIFALGENRTLLMITHRLQGLAQFDRVLTLDCGQLIES